MAHKDETVVGQRLGRRISVQERTRSPRSAARRASPPPARSLSPPKRARRRPSRPSISSSPPARCRPAFPASSRRATDLTSTGALSLAEVPRPAGDRRRLYRPRARLGLAAARRAGDGGRIPRPHPAGHGQRGARQSSACCRSRAWSSSWRQGHRHRKAGGRQPRARIEPAAGGEATLLDVDVALVAVGRKPYTEGLGLTRPASR